MNSTLYDRDFVQWTAETARLLRERRFDEIDAELVAEEIEDMGKRDRRELVSRLRVLLSHLLKLKFQPEKQSGSWRNTIRNQRFKLEQVLKDSPSLKAALPQWIDEAYAAAVARAADETGLPVETFPARCPFPPAQILDPDFFPD